MVYQRFMPEGWENNIIPISEEKLKNAKENGEILQGIVNRCDENGNLYIELGNGLNGKIPLEEVEAIKINEKGIPKKELCFNKVNKIVQFTVIGKDNKENEYILSRKKVGEKAIKWSMQELEEGNVVDGIVRNITDYGAFIEIGGGVTRFSIY